MFKKAQIIILGVIISSGYFISYAQSDIETLYIRRAIKEFVTKNYDKAIENLEQVLAANRNNKKAKKLLEKCHNRLGEEFLAQNQPEQAKQSFKKALEYDPNNAKASSGIISADEKIKITKAARSYGSAIKQPSAQSSPQQQTQLPAPFYMPPERDSKQDELMSAMVENFKFQNQAMVQQLVSSNKVMEDSKESKDKYLETMLITMQQKDNMTKQIFWIGGGIFAGVLIIIVGVFVFVVFYTSKSAELRSVQANETIAALLTAPAQDQPQRLMIGGPSTAGRAAEPQAVTSMDALNLEDPVQRAQAVEAVAAEIIEPEKNTMVEKINKLKELLNDDNNRVRANAAKAIYEIDKEESISTLKNMLYNDSNRMRASAIWALGEISSEECLDLILDIEGEDDEIVKYNIKLALEKVKSIKRFQITDEQETKIDTILKQYSELM